MMDYEGPKRSNKIKDGKLTADSKKYDGKIKTDLELAEAEKKSKKTKMSFRTAFSLSLKNLLTFSRKKISFPILLSLF